jgi:hypothetical protein
MKSASEAVRSLMHDAVQTPTIDDRYNIKAAAVKRCEILVQISAIKALLYTN